ncbi:major facilitator superfamily domain-containing protein [Aspergillus ambiguus]|uniref:major facilitator superfamily domain-containing protein n=1 Tax=Aspergillus ambiguus TaxID=176160 RepID=UPI003CCCF468
MASNVQEEEKNSPDIQPQQDSREIPSQHDPKDDIDVPYCVLSERRKIAVMLCASFMGMVSPMSAGIYYPSLPALAREMHVSNSLINLTVTTYLILQAIAPSFTGSFSDVYGRRPAYIFCFVVYLAANIGLALQSSYAALMVLRCVQAAGSSGTVVIGVAVVADISTRAERGKYIAYASIGTTLGTAIGPVIGGLIDHFLGWRWIFWFLAILSGVFLSIVLIFMPETCRVIVGNGSVSPPPWNRPLWALAHDCFSDKRQKGIDYDSLETRKKRPNPLTSVQIVLEKEAGTILVFGALIFSGYMIVISTLSAQLESQFGFNSIQVGLCYLPFGIGSLTSRWTVGPVLDWNFKREARIQNLPIVKNRQEDIRNFNIERTRLAVTMPLLYASCLCMIAYGWVMNFRTSLAGPIVMLFFTGHLMVGAFTTLSSLIVDTHRQSAATAQAANNLLRCLFAAGAAALASPLIDCMGIGWTGTFVAAVWAAFSPCLWLVYRRGHRWREDLRIKREERHGSTV